MIEIKEDFKVRLQKALNAQNMKPIDLSQRTGLSEATISQYRSGYSKPKSGRLVLIADALGVDPAWLMGLNVPMIPYTPHFELDGEQMELLAYFGTLNDEGREEALKRVSELTELERYKRELTDWEKMVVES